MSGFKSAEESRLELIAAMGQELGELFDALSSELTWIHWQWRQFRVLFDLGALGIEENHGNRIFQPLLQNSRRPWTND